MGAAPFTRREKMLMNYLQNMFEFTKGHYKGKRSFLSIPGKHLNRGELKRQVNTSNLKNVEHTRGQDAG